MRGTPFTSACCPASAGIIPAYAGNTEEKIVRVVHVWDHPRVCGEHFAFAFLEVSIEGSSPRMRGTQTTFTLKKPDRGIIPAYAGNTATRPSFEWLGEDHPRVCGEHVSRKQFRDGPLGSSPRMRGTLCLCGGRVG